MTNERAISIIENEIQIDVRLCTDRQVEQFQQALYLATDALRGNPGKDPLTSEQLDKMQGQPVWLEIYYKGKLKDAFWVLVNNENDGAYIHRGFWTPRYVGRYSPNTNDIWSWKAFSYPPAHIDREAWEPCLICSAQKMIINSGYCPHCGRPLTPEAWAMLEKRLRG